MIFPPLKKLRPGNVHVIQPGLNMNVKKEILSPQNTLQPLHTLSVSVTRYFTDVNGTILAKTDAGLVAAGMADKYPVFMLGQWDKESGYKAGLNIIPPSGNAKYYLTFVNGYGLTSNQIVTPFSGFNNLQQYLKYGDIVSVYTDNLLSPNYFAWIVQSSNVSGLASILNNTGTSQNDRRLMRLRCDEINLIADFTAQLPEAWHYVHVDNLGNVKDNQVSYNMFLNPFDVLPNVLSLPTEFILNQYIGIYLNMVLAVDTMSVNFNFKIFE